MSDPGPGREPSGTPPRYRRPAALFFEPPDERADEEHFFSLESISDPRELLDRSTELATAFQQAADRSVEYQALAAAQLADPARFDAWNAAAIADRAGWTEDYAVKMIEFGRKLRGRRA
ncbi:hypothetical protein SAMN06297387_102324 [Streptomyces zhaozhouensis]|uniref:Uncharacterized protein n=1 Tax=Streptomyces zhaozhouensis TaxID=1300267 RepID=A0A286DQI4_9ACTN|nr:hypothetical protein [Streptomyces zhaozhouensis]SOD60901.1 hypothetical protein SAMN06297387_102324 [Streptomyces zhaozhouensis]